MGNHHQQADTSDWEKIIRQIFEKAKADPEYASRKINADWVINYIWGKVIPFEADRWKRIEVRLHNCVTAIERLQVIAKRHGLISITGDDKLKIGQLCAEAYFKDPTNLYTPHMKLLEPDGIMVVNTYPSRFTKVVDAIIYEYFKLTAKKEK